jgi:hypothetical protein
MQLLIILVYYIFDKLEWNDGRHKDCGGLFYYVPIQLNAKAYRCNKCQRVISLEYKFKRSKSVQAEYDLNKIK